MRATYAQMQSMYENGYVRLEGVVPPVMVREALRAINHSLGEKGMNEADMPILRSQTYCREVTKTPAILDMVNKTPAFEIAESFIAPGRLGRPGGAQIALRFPSMSDRPGKPHPHLDGVGSQYNGTKSDRVYHFTMLISVVLADVTEPNQGNFTVWPGTHRRFAEYFKQHSPMTLYEGMPKVDMPEPVQVLAKAGDVILTHYQLAHTAGPHLGPNIRYACFFRLYRDDHASFGDRVMTDIWAEWDGLRAAIPQANTPEPATA